MFHAFESKFILLKCFFSSLLQLGNLATLSNVLEHVEPQIALDQAEPRVSRKC